MIILVALCWTLSSIHMFLFYWGLPNRTQCSRCGLTRAEKRGRITSLDLSATLFRMHHWPSWPQGHIADSWSACCPLGLLHTGIALVLSSHLDALCGVPPDSPHLKHSCTSRCLQRAWHQGARVVCLASGHLSCPGAASEGTAAQCWDTHDHSQAAGASTCALRCKYSPRQMQA